MAPTSSQNSSDPWDQPTASVRLLATHRLLTSPEYFQQTSFRPRALVKAAPIPDDWEDDEDDEEPQNEDDNRRIWEDACVVNYSCLEITEADTDPAEILNPQTPCQL